MNNGTRLEQQLLDENEAMAKYALASGKDVTGDLAQGLNDLLTLRSAPAEVGSETGNGTPPTQEPSVSSAQTVKHLALIHSRLSQLVAPAKPGAILYLQEQSAKAGVFGFLGPVQLIRRMMLAATVFLAVVISTSVSDQVNPANLAAPVLSLSGSDQMLTLAYLMSAAGIGGAFAALFQANRYVTEGTFEPKYQPTYWTRLALGVIAGLIISAMVPLDLGDVSDLAPAEGLGSTGGDSDNGSTAMAQRLLLAKPTLALLGGFSAGAVYRILSRLVDAIESFFRGDARMIIAAREELVNAQVDGKLNGVRMETAARLMTLQRGLAQGQSTEELERRLASVLDDLLPSGSVGLAQGNARSTGQVKSEAKSAPPAGTEQG